MNLGFLASTVLMVLMVGVSAGWPATNGFAVPPFCDSRGNTMAGSDVLPDPARNAPDLFVTTTLTVRLHPSPGQNSLHSQFLQRCAAGTGILQMPAVGNELDCGAPFAGWTKGHTPMTAKIEIARSQGDNER